ncbi:hypothetical protein AGLY_013330 [Aphis glycines]|uniref:Uncharacterized protein n=1 Tax=Aphis glycines TaxID=307491 RepID=A0A6G0T7B0_APHGL|nr:hypothetical protein AGLY_013330 [Aphis glycines]
MLCYNHTLSNDNFCQYSSLLIKRGRPTIVPITIYNTSTHIPTYSSHSVFKTLVIAVSDKLLSRVVSDSKVNPWCTTEVKIFKKNETKQKKSDGNTGIFTQNLFSTKSIFFLQLKNESADNSHIIILRYIIFQECFAIRSAFSNIIHIILGIESFDLFYCLSLKDKQDFRCTMGYLYVIMIRKKHIRQQLLPFIIDHH